MKKPSTWQSVRAEVMERLSSKVWRAGELIPGEVDLAEEFGCARATVNRALRDLADAGYLERRRKGGTRVAKHPVRKATLDIPITRLEIERRGAVYGHEVMAKAICTPPVNIRETMGLKSGTEAMHLQALHRADGEPFMLEDRWVNVEAAPNILSVDFGIINANEWLVGNALFSKGDIAFSAANASKAEAVILECSEGDAIFITDRTTWHKTQSVTSVRLAYAPGFHMQTEI